MMLPRSKTGPSSAFHFHRPLAPRVYFPASIIIRGNDESGPGQELIVQTVIADECRIGSSNRKRRAFSK